MCGGAGVNSSGFYFTQTQNNTYLTVDGGPRPRAQRELPPGLLELLQPVHPTLGSTRGKDMFAISCAEIRYVEEFYLL